MYLKAKNSLHATQISSFYYVFIVFFETDAKIYIYLYRINATLELNYTVLMQKIFKTELYLLNNQLNL